MSDAPARLNAALEGRYAIERELGEGGMAVVYLAQDLRHERKVALKVLKPELEAVVGAERFLAEITTTANLTHPHILPLHDSGEADSFLFYVMPHIEGESLRERIDREKQLGVDDAVAITQKVADALDYAHGKGVVHRDIKPGNILLSERGEPLVADFGIALAVAQAGGGRITETGLSLGTPHYMSPEQATGDRDVDPRSDVYALGCVLYEMLVGEPPYPGATAQAVLGKIISGKPVSATEQRPSIPANVDAAVRKALEKLPADRFTSAQEFVRALADEHFRYGELAAAGAGVAVGPWNRLTVVGWSLAAVTTLIAGWSLLRPEPPQPVTRFELTHRDSLQLTSGLALSPDGTRIVWRRTSADGGTQFYLRELGQLSSAPIPGTEGARSHSSFSPDGQSIAFVNNESLMTVSLAGGPPTTLVSDSVIGGGAGGVSWGLDGMIYFVKEGSRMRIWRVPVDGGEEEQVSTAARAGEDHGRLNVLPNGKGVLFTRFFRNSPDPNDIAVLSLETGVISTLGQEGVSMARYAHSGHIVYTSRDGTLWAAPFDMNRLEVTGPSRAMLEGVRVAVNGASDFALSETGVLVYRSGVTGPEEGVLVWLGRDGSEEVLDSRLSGIIEAPALSPDGRSIAFDRASGGERHIWIYDLADGTSSRLTFEGTDNRRPAWSPDGSEVAFVSNREVGFTSQRGDARAVYARRWDGSGTARLLRAPVEGTILWEALWTPDERWLVYR